MEIRIENADITEVAADLVVMKFANGLRGADQAVAGRLGFEDFVEHGARRIVPGAGVAAKEVAFIGVGRLHKFRYREIQAFGAEAVDIARTRPRSARHLALTVHGPGYGLDTEQAFLSLIAGLVGAWRQSGGPLERITICEISETRRTHLRTILRDKQAELQMTEPSGAGAFAVRRELSSAPEAAASALGGVGARAEEMARLFVAMPFDDAYLDEFEIGFLEAAKANGYVCERLDLEHFTGDIVAEIKSRIIGSHGVIALVNGLNPNVFLEIGFAWANEKPTILVAREGVALPFDVSGHRCVRYRSIVDLRRTLSAEIAALKAKGVFAAPA